ncbi:hypothetical protein [Cronobacter sakazakii]|uniref:hypothetical protein n=1 Tax=Cronobacter sakazakii TaxID=28141 RepID=UPI0011865E3D|nr:hypothetical protein [Cronobacter sakazakii]
MPENPASYRVVRTKSYLFNKAMMALLLCFYQLSSRRVAAIAAELVQKRQLREDTPSLKPAIQE